MGLKPNGREYPNILEQLFELELIKIGQNLPSNSIQDLFSKLAESEQISVLSRVAVINQKSFSEILKYFPDEKLRSHLYRAMLKDGLWKWQPEQRLAVLLQMPPDILQTSPSVVIDVVLTNQDRLEEVRTLLDAIANVPSSHSDSVMEVYTPLRSFLEGTGDLTEVVDQVQRELGSGSISESVLRTCTAAPEILKAVGKSALLPSLANACMQVYQQEGNLTDAARNALVKLLQSTRELNADDVLKIIENISGYTSYLESVNQVTLALMREGHTGLALNVARGARPGEISYADLLKQAMSAEGAEPQALWAEIKNTDRLDSRHWMVPHEELTAAGAAFLDKIIAEDADFMAQSIVDNNNRFDQSNGFRLLSKERLLALANKVSKPDLRVEALNVLALKIRANDPAEMIDAVWNLPDNDIDAAYRITSIRLGMSLTTKGVQ